MRTLVAWADPLPVVHTVNDLDDMQCNHKVLEVLDCMGMTCQAVLI